MNQKEKNKNRALTFIIVGLIFVLSLIQLFISHHLATAGETVKKLEMQASALEQENALFKEEISKEGSLSKISQEAEKLSLVRASKILYLTSQIPVALER